MFENIPFWMWPGIVAYNAQMYGGNYLNDLKDFAFGSKRTSQYYPSMSMPTVRREEKPLRFEFMMELRNIVRGIERQMNAMFP